jgi:hypothetical protein
MRILILLLLFPFLTIAQDIWLQKDSVNGAPRSVASTFVVLGEAYIVGGLDYDGFRRRMYSYAYFQDDWDDELSLGGLNGDGNERGSASSFEINNKGYVCLGQGVTNQFFKDLWEYDPVQQTWTQKADFLGSPRRQACAFTIYDTAYVGTGSDANGLCKDFYKYDPSTNSWSQIADFEGSARKEAVGFALGINGYVGTGDDGVKKKDFWRYHASSDMWEQLADFPGTARKGAVGWGAWPQGFICCGEDINSEFKNDLWEYNYYSNSWIQRASIPGPGRTNPVAFQLNGFAFVGTGYNGEFLDDMWAYQRILSTKNLSEADFDLFPNPNNGKFYATINPTYNYQIHDQLGRNVTSEFSKNELIGRMEFTSNSPVSGTYILQVQDKNGNFVGRKKISIN